MVIRRIRENVTKHNWFAVGVDLLIVIVGVFLGLQADNWNEARLERQQEQSYRSRLIEDLRANESDLQQRRIYYRQVRHHALAALAVFEEPSRPAGLEFLVDAYQATQIVPRTLTRFTYDEMIAAGRVDRIGDVDLRQQVKNYYAGMATVETSLRVTPPYREHLRTVMPYYWQRQMRTNCREILTTAASGEQMNILPRSCRLQVGHGNVSQAVARVRASPGITGDLTRYLIDLELKLDLFDLLEGRARRLRQTLESQSS